jgi:hypothetical protein
MKQKTTVRMMETNSKEELRFNSTTFSHIKDETYIIDRIP